MRVCGVGEHDCKNWSQLQRFYGIRRVTRVNYSKFSCFTSQCTNGALLLDSSEELLFSLQHYSWYFTFSYLLRKKLTLNHQSDWSFRCLLFTYILMWYNYAPNWYSTALNTRRNSSLSHLYVLVLWTRLIELWNLHRYSTFRLTSDFIVVVIFDWATERGDRENEERLFV